VTLSHELGMLVVAEGVETVGERDALVEMGCTYLQGYLLARPGPPFGAVSWA
jgi:EAL domain-containing protein (putative c-di-GMP-specific phosphodiesterase class I)